MSVNELVAELTRRGVRLTAHDNQLAIEAPSNESLTPELLDRLRAAKPALLAALTGSPAKPSQPAPPGWDDRTAAELVAEADGMVAAVGVDGSHPAVQSAASLVASAIQARDMAALRYALDEFRDAVSAARHELGVTHPEYAEAHALARRMAADRARLVGLLRDTGQRMGWPRVQLAPWMWIESSEDGWDRYLACPAHDPDEYQRLLAALAA